MGQSRSPKRANPDVGAFRIKLKTATGRNTTALSNARFFGIVQKNKRVRWAPPFKAQALVKQKKRVLYEYLLEQHKAHEKALERERARYAAARVQHREKYKPKDRKPPPLTEVLGVSKKTARSLEKRSLARESRKIEKARKFVEVQTDAKFEQKVSTLARHIEKNYYGNGGDFASRRIVTNEVSSRGNRTPENKRGEKANWLDFHRSIMGEGNSIRWIASRYMRGLKKQYFSALAKVIKERNKVRGSIGDLSFSVFMTTSLNKHPAVMRSSIEEDIRVNFRITGKAWRDHWDQIQFQLFRAIIRTLYDGGKYPDKKGGSPTDSRKLTSSGVFFRQKLQSGKSLGKNVTLTQNFKLAFTLVCTEEF